MLSVRYLILFLTTFLLALFLEYSVLRKNERDILKGDIIKILAKIFLGISIIIAFLITYDVFINLKEQFTYINDLRMTEIAVGMAIASVVFEVVSWDFEHWLKRKFVKKNSFLDKNKSLVENFAIFHNYSSISKKRMQFINLMILFGQITLCICAFNIIPIIFEAIK